MTLGGLSEDAAQALVDDKSIWWHQRFRLSPGVWTPGVNDIGSLMDVIGVPADLSGQSLLDIGTMNGGAAFIAEQRGAERVVAVDIYPPDRFGFDRIRDAFGSAAEFVQASIYNLPAVLREQFDHVVFFGVLYHLRHPLLAIDSLHALTRTAVYVESAACADIEGCAHAEFYPQQYLGDASNWFVPSVQCMVDWFTSSGFDVERIQSWPQPDLSRASLIGRPTAPSYTQVSYEVPLEVIPGKPLPR